MSESKSPIKVYMTKSQLTKLMSQKGKISEREAARIFGIGRDSVRRYWSGERIPKLDDGPVARVDSTAGCIQIKDLLVQYDLVGKILEKVSATTAGSVWGDDSLRQSLDIGNERWRKATGSMRLAGHWHALPDKTRVWGSKATISRLSTQIKEL